MGSLCTNKTEKVDKEYRSINKKVSAISFHY